MSPKTTKAQNSKVLGDAAEYYALSQFAFAGRPGTKMPDNWEGYDLAVETGTEKGQGTGLQRVSVKLRTESDGWKAASWFMFDDRRECDWIVFIFKQKEGALRSWIIPFTVAKDYANVPGPERKDPWMRDISFEKLQKKPLCDYENNWELHAGLSPDQIFFGPSLFWKMSGIATQSLIGCHRSIPPDRAAKGQFAVNLGKRCQIKKQQIEQVVADLPEDVDVDHLIEHLHLLDKLEKSEQQLARGEGISHEAAKQRLRQWLK